MKNLAIIISLLAVIILLGQSQTLGQDTMTKVYWMSTVDVPLGKLGEFHAFMEKEFLPVHAKYGYKQVAAWQTIVGSIEKVIYIAEFENMEAYNKARVAFLNSDEWKSLSKKFDTYAKNVKTTFLRGLPYSKLK